jgi:hypothetical protein
MRELIILLAIVMSLVWLCIYLMPIATHAVLSSEHVIDAMRYMHPRIFP